MKMYENVWKNSKIWQFLGLLCVSCESLRRPNLIEKRETKHIKKNRKKKKNKKKKIKIKK